MTQRTLAPCPETPNCVSSQAPASDRTHHLEPIWFTGERAAAMAAVLEAIGTLPRTTIVQQDGTYVHAVSRSRILRFKDDLEVVVGEGRIDLRAAARLGGYDFGVNRDRAETLAAEVRERLAQR